MDGDTVERDDAEWSSAAASVLSAKRDSEAAGAKADEAKLALVGLCRHPREQGYGVSVTRYWKAGNVDYRKIPGLKVVD